MGTDVAIRDPQRVGLSSEQLRYISNTEFVPPGLRGNLPAILACVATGRELGIGDLAALKSIHIIDGKASFSAELMVQLVRAHGHSITGEVSEGSAVLTGTRCDNGDEMSSTWTLAMAERAGLLNKQNWKRYPEAMLWARAVSQLCRMLFADCFAGKTYMPEEIEDAELLDDQDSGSEPLEADAIASTPPRTEAVTDEQPSDPAPSAAQVKKLNVLVGQLREAGRITNEQLWRSTSREPVASEDGQVHWSPLRELLSKDEASALIERLQKYQDASVRDSEPVAS